MQSMDGIEQEHKLSDDLDDMDSEEAMTHGGRPPNLSAPPGVDPTIPPGP